MILTPCAHTDRIFRFQSSRAVFSIISCQNPVYTTLAPCSIRLYLRKLSMCRSAVLTSTQLCRFSKCYAHVCDLIVIF